MAQRNDPREPSNHDPSAIYERLPDHVETTEAPFDIAAGFQELTHWMQRNSDLVDPEVFDEGPRSASEDEEIGTPPSSDTTTRKDWWRAIRNLAGVDAVRLAAAPEDTGKFNALGIIVALSAGATACATFVAIDVVLAQTLLTALLLALMFLVLQASFTAYSLSRFTVHRQGLGQFTLRGAGHLLLLQALVTLPLSCALALFFFGEDAVRATGTSVEVPSPLDQGTALLALAAQDIAAILAIAVVILASAAVMTLPLLVRQLGGVTVYDRRSRHLTADEMLHEIELKAHHDAVSSEPAHYSDLVAHTRQSIAAQLARTEAELEVEFLEQRSFKETHRRDSKTSKPMDAEKARLDLLESRVIQARRHRENLRDDLPQSILVAATEPRRSRALMNSMIYGGAAAAEAGLNYMAFQLMGAGWFETTVLAASVVIINVFLPKQIGELVAKRRAGKFSKFSKPTVIASAGFIWIGASSFVAIIRAAYIEVVTIPIFTGSLSFLTEILSTPVLTAGWLFVVLGIGVVVAMHSAATYRPEARSLWQADTQVERLERELYRQRARVVHIQATTGQLSGREQYARSKLEASRTAANELAKELGLHYEQHLTRLLAVPVGITDHAAEVDSAIATPLRSTPGMVARPNGGY